MQASADFPCTLQEVAMTHTSMNITQPQTLQGASINGIGPFTNHTLPITECLSNIRYSEQVPQKIAMKTSWLKKCQITCTKRLAIPAVQYVLDPTGFRKHKLSFIHCTSESDSQAAREGG